MNDHNEHISAEEELAAELTALALGELSAAEQAELEAELAQRPSSGNAPRATAGLSSSADVAQLANALRQADRSKALPAPSATLRELLESKLVDDVAVVDLKKPGSLGKPRRRVWIALATCLSLLLVAIPVRQFLMNGQSRESNAELAQLQAVNDRLRAETNRADDALAIEAAARRSAMSGLESRQKELSESVLSENERVLGELDADVLKLREEIRLAQQDRDEKAVQLLVTPRIIVGEEEEARLGITPVPAGGANDGSNQPGTTTYAVPLYTQSSPAPRYLAESELVRGGQASVAQGVPDPTQLASGPSARGRGTLDLSEGLSRESKPRAEDLAQYRRQALTVAESKAGEEDVMPLSKWHVGLSEQLGFANEQYAQIVENRFASVGDEPLSTFSIDVDTASYANARRFLSQNQIPPANAIRIEEFINYFSYDYPAPKEGEPFSVNMEVAACPWQPAHQLVRIGLKGKEVPQSQRPASNVVFLLDVSGSMQDANKLPLLKQAMKLLTDQLTESDRVSIVTYAGNAGLALDTTNGESKQTIREAIDALNADGSTNGSAGIQLAYEKATQSFIKAGANRVILATDGDLNVGVTDDDALVEMIKQKAASGVFLTVLGFGEGNLQDGKLEKLADNGNGMYAYVDSLREARKVLVEQIAGSLVTIAKDVKIKVEFNPAEVAAYRLLGYENRLMSAPDFNNDAKDAGEIGAGHTVTALYEIVPTKLIEPLASTAVSLKYQRPVTPTEPPKELTAAAKTGELLTLFLRYKRPDANESTLSEFTVESKQRAFDDASPDFRFAAAVASFGMLLRNSEFRGNSSLADVEQIASSAIGSDPQGHRTELLDLVRKAATLPSQGR